MGERPPLAVVVQRYGPDVTGGSESLARAVAERLTGDYQVTVLTTCARDYVSWRNERAPGTEVVAGVEVRRFPVEEERDLEDFNRFSDTLYDRPHGREQEIDWLRRQGPYVPALVRELETARDRFHAVMFFTYLYYPTFWGLKAAPERSVLVPTTHDEPPLRFEIYREMFALPRAFAFLTPPEETLVRSRFELEGRPAMVTGIGVETPPHRTPRGFVRTMRWTRPTFSTPAASTRARVAPRWWTSTPTTATRTRERPTCCSSATWPCPCRW